jgi:hypothetical protein
VPPAIDSNYPGGIFQNIGYNDLDKACYTTRARPLQRRLVRLHDAAERPHTFRRRALDSHRAPLVIVSRWVKRGYVSHTHIDVASLHKLFAHILGKPYNNAIVANAALPLGLFTSTPDFAPFTHAPQKQALARTWTFEEPDEQPGLDSQVTGYLMGL